MKNQTMKCTVLVVYESYNQLICMFLSDLIPLTIFTIHYNHTSLWGPIMSRLCSLLYHAFQPNYPSLLILDHLGICSMAFSVPAACAMAEDGWGGDLCGVYNVATILVAGGVAVEIVVHGIFRRKIIFNDAEHALIALALIGNAPVLAIIACPAIEAHRRLLFTFSLAAFAFGYCILKPAHHVLWHWAAAAAQAAGVVAVGY
jgi:hypothetical protein